MKKIYFLFFSYLIGAGYLMAQRHSLHLFAGGGIINYAGDLKDHPLPQSGYINPHVKGGVEWQYKHMFRLGASYMYGELTGDDAFTNQTYERNLRFYSYLHDVGVDFKFNFLGFPKDNNGIYSNTKKENVFEFYAEVGTGIIFTNPMADDGAGNMVELRPLGTEGQYINDPAYDDIYSTVNVRFKTGLGFYWNFTRWVGLNVYVNYNFTTTDYIDDVGGNYPDYLQLLLAQNGDRAVNYSWRGNGPFPDQGTFRGGGFTDGYLVIGGGLDVTIARFGRKDKWQVRPCSGKRKGKISSTYGK